MAQPAPANWLDPCRLGLAALVIVFHSFVLLGRPEPLRALWPQLDLGALAVAGFLLLSGYLISGAWARQPALGPYLRNRLLRIAPGFWVAFLVSVLVVGPLGAAWKPVRRLMRPHLGRWARPRPSVAVPCRLSVTEKGRAVRLGR